MVAVTPRFITHKDFVTCTVKLFGIADYMVWKVAYLSGAVFVGLSCMEDWEVLNIAGSSYSHTVYMVLHWAICMTSHACHSTGQLPSDL